MLIHLFLSIQVYLFKTASDLHAGLGIPQLLEAILKLLPLDTYVPSPVQDHESLNDVSRREIRTGFLSLWATCCLFNLSVSLLLKAAVMDLVESDKQRCLAVPVWDTYTRLLGQAGCQVKGRSHLMASQLFFDPWPRFFPFACSRPLRGWSGFLSMSEPRKPTLLWQQGAYLSLPSFDLLYLNVSFGVWK